MGDSSISDIPKYKQLRDEIRQTRLFYRALPFLKVVLGLDDETTGRLRSLQPQVNSIGNDVEKLSSLPDRFNDLFSEHGWIMYDRMSPDVAESAILKAESGDLDSAEAILAEYFSPARVNGELPTMLGVRAFRSRMSLAEKAVADYGEARYHACIPLVLALLDGMIREISRHQKNPFDMKSSFTAWDSVVGHDKGLNALHRIFAQKRFATNSEKITIPYRHGIMHGSDLNWDNHLVAAKTWAALFAFREWALKAERGELSPPPENPPKTISQQLQEIRHTLAETKRIQEWKPRTIPSDAPALRPDVRSLDLERGTPEHWFAEYLELLKRRNYGTMVKYIGRNPERLWEKPIEKIKSQFKQKHLLAFTFLEIADSVYCTTVIKVRLTFEVEGQSEEHVVTSRLINEDSQGEFVTLGNPDGQWFIQNFLLS